MKITIICGAGILSGKEMMALELGQGLRKAGHEVSYVTSLWGDGKFRARLDELGFTKACMRIGFISATLTLECLRMTADQLLRVPGLWLDYMRFLRKETPDQIIHTNWHHLLVLWPFLNTHRDWFWLHDVIPEKPQYQKVFRGLSRRMRGFAPVSQAVKESLLRIGIPENKIHVIHNGLTNPVPEKYAPRQVVNQVRFGIVGQVAPWKGHQYLLEAFSLIATKHPASELHVFGDGSLDYVNQLKQRAKVLGLGSRLFWHGFVVERADIYSLIDLCVVASCATEALPTVAIEAAYFGLPVIATRIGGLPEIVQESVTGFLVESGHPAELAARLDELLGDAEMRRRMGAAAAQHARTHFSQERFVTEFLGLMSK
jgi:glycosyltransferase involved in cell wall biosynthesis